MNFQEALAEATKEVKSLHNAHQLFTTFHDYAWPPDKLC